MSILVTAVCALLEEHRPDTLQVGVQTADGVGYVVEYDPAARQLRLFDCGCGDCRAHVNPGVVC